MYGNLTGEKSESFKEHEKKITDQYVIDYAYTDDGRNLLIEKRTPEGLKVSYAYLPSTNLCTKDLRSYQGKIQERTFYSYDENGQVKSEIEDDGCGTDEDDLADVTFRKMKVVEAVKTPGPSFGKPQQKWEYYQDLSNNQPIPLKRIEFIYDARGREIQQRIYNGQNVFCYEITKEYDTRGRVIQETNALGEITQYEWDDHNNKTKERIFKHTHSGPKGANSIGYEYDLANRLVRKIEKHSNGEVFTTSYAYNVLSQLISETDHYGHETTYSYDLFGNQTQCMKPLMQDASGTSIRPTIHKQYNLLGQAIVATDENGMTTHYSYNAYGSPTQITYPDGAIERFVYYPSGWLKQKWLADGSSICYTYDPKGRLLKECMLDPNGSLIKEEEYGYKGPLLQYHKDAAGLVTTYRYDGAGRNIEENIGQLKIIRYEYDDFGRVIKTEQVGRQEIIQYDWLDRIISKILQDSQGNIYSKEAYEYDRFGNQIKKTAWQFSYRPAVICMNYYSDGTLSSKYNPLSQRTYWRYDHHHLNEHGQCVQSRTCFDPMERPTKEVDDAHRRIAAREVYEGDKLLSRIQYAYDAVGHLTQEHAVVMADGQPLREYWITRSYNPRGLLESEIEMPQGKTTRYRYDSMGRLIQKEKPDGVALNYTYDALGRKQSLTSSDSTISYTYAYDLHDNIIQVQDHVHGRIQNRIFDRWNRLLAEEINPGIFIYFAYDALDRLIRMELPDRSFLVYTYDYHLRKIQRYDAMSQLAYECECMEYDLQGHLLKSKTPAGIASYSYDLLGRPIAIQTPHWESILEQFDSVGNLLKMKQRDPNGIVDWNFAYDRFNHLSTESTIESNKFTYDSLGNCIRKNNDNQDINALNQLTRDGGAHYSYDANGNLLAQSTPRALYTYDALDRLISCEKEGDRTTFVYDAFGRCVQINNALGTKKLLFQGDQEIGSVLNGQIQEFRLIHPDSKCDMTLAMELKGQTYFPIQDFRGNICALQKQDGSLAEWTRYSAFGLKIVQGDLQNRFNPWKFANRREIADLSLFTHRFYNPRLMRWQTADPLGFEDGLNLYAYVHNNPFYYKDPDGIRLCYSFSHWSIWNGRGSAQRSNNRSYRRCCDRSNPWLGSL